MALIGVSGCGWLGSAVPEPDPQKVAAMAKPGPSGPQIEGETPSPADSVSGNGNGGASESFLPIETFANWSLETTVADALARIGVAAVPELVQSLQHEDPEQRLRAAQVLTRIGPDAKIAVPALVELLHDPDPLVRKQAVRALGQLGPDAAMAVPELVKMLQTVDPNRVRHDSGLEQGTVEPPSTPNSPSFYQRTSPEFPGNVSTPRPVDHGDETARGAADATRERGPAEPTE